MERIEHLGWPNCYRLSNSHVEAIVTTDIGPRVVHFGLAGHENVFYVSHDDSGQMGGNAWRLYGGHRLWHAPEANPRTYAPDNGPVEIAESEGNVTLTPPTEPLTGIQKTLALMLDPAAAHLTVSHRLTNHNLWAVKLAPWALSVMAGGGVGIIPLPPRGSHQDNLLPTSSIVTWAYTDMSDPRFTWGRQYILVRQDGSAQVEQKVGVTASQGWAGYVRQGILFAKTFATTPGATYPDLGCTVEMYTDANLLEVETLGPLAKIGPGETVEHIEEWYLFHDVETPRDDGEVERYVLPYIKLIK